MAKKKSRKSRTSNGVIGNPGKARCSTGMQRLLNQFKAHKAGKKVKVFIGGNDTISGSEMWPARVETKV
jgi:uncharacterized protein YidB (DUF937 family)